MSAAGCMALETNRPAPRPDGGSVQVGLVALNQTNRSISFPVAVNLREETVEYAVVHKAGKTHESMFRTEARPQDIHVAMLLLGAKPAMTNFFGADGRASPTGSLVSVEVEWSNRGVPSRCPLEDLVLDRQTTNSLPRGDWIYNGSNFSEGMFTAERDGSIISLHSDADALVNNPRPGRTNDDLHLPFAAKLPPMGTPAIITIKLLPAR